MKMRAYHSHQWSNTSLIIDEEEQVLKPELKTPRPRSPVARPLSTSPFLPSTPRSPRLPRLEGPHAGGPRHTSKALAASLAAYIILTLTSLAGVGLLYWALLPSVEQLREELDLPDSMELKLTFPKSFEELEVVRSTVVLYLHNYAPQITLLFCVAFFVLQVFNIPGSFFLTILAGSVYPFPLAMLILGVMMTSGCALNYLFTRHLFAPLVWRCFPTHITAFHHHCMAHRGSLINVLIFLRIMPVFPGFVLNIGCPLVRVPLFDFLVGTLVGIQPKHALFLSTGYTIGEIKQVSDLYTLRTIITLLLCGTLSLLPLLCKMLVGKAPAGAGAGGDSFGGDSVSAGVASKRGSKLGSS